MDTLVSSLSFVAIAAAVFLLARQFDKRILVTFAFLCAIYLAADDFVTGLPNMAPSLDILGGSKNWTGKFFSLALSAAVIAWLRLSPHAVGLTFKQRHTKIGLFAILFFIVWGTCLGLFFKLGIPSAENLAFQATMPGLSEELVFRGIAPALLLGLLRNKGPTSDIPWAVILATSVVFGVWHGLSYSDGQFGFNVMSALFPLIGSIPGGWLRFKTGSLVFPVVAHSLANVAFHVAGVLGT